MKTKMQITEAGIALSKYRGASQNLLKETFSFISKVTSILDEINKQEELPQEIKGLIDEIFEQVRPDIESCIKAGNEYTDSLQDDYGKAIEILVKLRESL
ncbi:TPA: hypothetical protein QIS90_001262 [Providencia rettgeri]|nr:hypothetical protein [Providencia rettgeri]